MPKGCPKFETHHEKSMKYPTQNLMLDSNRWMYVNSLRWSFTRKAQTWTRPHLGMAIRFPDANLRH